MSAQDPASPPVARMAHAELMALSNFSFQRGASHPEELVARAHALGYSALALTDECTVAGVVRAHAQARLLGLRFLPGASFVFSHGDDEAGSAHDLSGWEMLVLPRHLDGWGCLCQYITTARAAAPKGRYRAHVPTPGELAGCEIVLLPQRHSPGARTLNDLKSEAVLSALISVKCHFLSENNGLWLGAMLHQSMDDDWWLMQLHHWAETASLPLVAVGGALMHARSRKPLHDVLTAVRRGRPVADCAADILPNAQAHLRTRLQLARVYPPPLLDAAIALADRCQFSLGELRYHYPTETVTPGLSAAQTLAGLTWAGVAWRYGGGVLPAVAQMAAQGDSAVAASLIPAELHQQIEDELALIAELGYEMYFLTVHDLVRFARERGILCQGRGSAANSAVCYCLGITEVDPTQSTLLFGRFISRERGEPPDIDVDFEHQRREEVIQYIYAKYGRDRAALAATVISYRPRSALRDVGRALQVDDALIRALAQEHPGMYSREVLPQRLAQAIQHLPSAIPVPDERTQALWLELAQQLMGFPRHLSQHVGGFVLTDGPLTRLVPVEPAAMAGRSIIQWDKDDLDAMGLLKVDVLALGMLSALRRALDMLTTKPDLQAGVAQTPLPGQLDVRHPHARCASGRLTLAAVPKGDEATYRMVSNADTIGVFQVESRAQMSMLPRLRPRTFYDLVVQVAIVRPGPIQGGMVHPYLRRRHQLEPVAYPSPALEQALGRTLGVPIFQEQVMQVAMLCAGFSAGEADSLRRAMAAWKRKGGVQRFYDRVVGGMLARGYTAAFAEQIFAQIEGFGEYGFPESHAASFAQLVYVSAWIKCHHPDVFLAALLNSQPMGFYAPSQLVQDARRHGVEVWPVDVLASEWDCTLAAIADAPLAGAAGGKRVGVRLGLRMVSGLGEMAGQRVAQARVERARQGQCWRSVAELAQHAGLGQHELNALAAADALRSLVGHRRDQVWAAAGARPDPGLWAELSDTDDLLTPGLVPPPTLAQDVVGDYAATGLSLRPHPLSFLRPRLRAERLLPAAELAQYPHGRLARACGIVTVRQQPGTAKGVVFVTLEDETGTVNVVVWRAVKDAQRDELMHARLLAVYGVWQRSDDAAGQVCHLVAKRLRDLTPWLGALDTHSRDFH